MKISSWDLKLNLNPDLSHFSAESVAGITGATSSTVYASEGGSTGAGATDTAFFLALPCPGTNGADRDSLAVA